MKFGKLLRYMEQIMATHSSCLFTPLHTVGTVRQTGNVFFGYFRKKLIESRRILARPLNW